MEGSVMEYVGSFVIFIASWFGLVCFWRIFWGRLRWVRKDFEAGRWFFALSLFLMFVFCALFVVRYFYEILILGVWDYSGY